MPSPLPNIPLIPAEVEIRQMPLIDTINVGTSFFLNITGFSLLDIKNLLYTIRRIFDGRAKSVNRREAFELYTNLGLTSIADVTNAQDYDFVIAIADYYVYRSSHP
jgi:hypothetical protein